MDPPKGLTPLNFRLQLRPSRHLQWKRRSTLSQPCRALAYWLQTQLFNFWASYKVVDSESFNFYFLGFGASGLGGVCSLGFVKTIVCSHGLKVRVQGVGLVYRIWVREWML